MMKIVLEEDAGEQKTLRVFAETKDISWGGFCLKFSEIPQDERFTPENAHLLVDKPVIVKMHRPKVTIWGNIIRLDIARRELAVIIAKISDIDQWQALCDRT